MTKRYFKSFLILGFSVICLMQCIALLKEYLTYPTIQKVSIKTFKFNFPAITFCHTNTSALFDFVSDVKCYLSEESKNFCNFTKYPVMFTTRASLVCVTYFSQFVKRGVDWDEDVIVADIQLNFESSLAIEKGSLHSPTMPPMMAQLDTFGCLRYSKFSVTNVLRKPAPYDTNCADYITDFDKKYLSQYHCRFYCKTRQCFDNCPKDCYYFYYEESVVSDVLEKYECSFNETRTIHYRFSKDVDENVIIYQEKLTLLFVFIQSGGLLSLWFGFSFIQLAQFLKYRITAHEITFTIYLLLNTVCIYQIAVVCTNYLKYKVTTSIELSSYEAAGVMPKIEMVIPGDGIDIITAKEILEDDIECQVKLNNGSIFHPQQISIKGTKTFFCVYGYKRKGIKSVIYQMNVSRLDQMDTSIGLQAISELKNEIWLSRISYPQVHDITFRMQTLKRLGAPFEFKCHK